MNASDLPVYRAWIDNHAEEVEVIAKYSLPRWRDVATDPPRRSQNLLVRISMEEEDSYVGQYYYQGRTFYVLDVTGKMMGIPDPYQWAEILVPLEKVEFDRAGLEKALPSAHAEPAGTPQAYDAYLGRAAPVSW